MAATDLTVRRLRELLHYDPETGVFTWRKTVGPRARVGCRTGSLSHYGYLEIRIDGKLQKAHRLAWMYAHGAWPEFVIDHLNGKRTDNRIANLRDVPRRVNLENTRSARSDNTSGLLGVSFHKASNSYKASIKAKGRLYALGYHKSPEDAHQAYLAAKRKLHEGCTI